MFPRRFFAGTYFAPMYFPQSQGQVLSAIQGYNVVGDRLIHHVAIGDEALHRVQIGDQEFHKNVVGDRIR